MSLSLIHRIADYVDPRRKAHITYHTQVADHSFKVNTELRSALEAKNGSTQGLVDKLGDAALSITKLRDGVKSLRAALFVTRAYAMDDYDDALAALEALPVRSKKRPEAELLLATIKTDLKKIADVLAATGAL